MSAIVSSPIYYKDIPGWKVHKVVHSGKGGVTCYDIYAKTYIPTIKDYFNMGTLYCDNGCLHSGVLNGDTPFFGTNVKNAVRYLFLKTQEPRQ